MKFYLTILLSFCLLSCHKKKNQITQTYQGVIVEAGTGLPVAGL